MVEKIFKTQKIFKNIRKDEIVKFGSPVLFFLIFVSILTLILSFKYQSYEKEFNEGDIALENVYAPFDFSYNTSIDAEKTENRREEAAREVPPVFDFDYQGISETNSAVERLFKKVQEYNPNSLGAEEKANISKDIKNSISINLDIPVIQNLLEVQDIKSIRSTTFNILDSISKKVILTGKDLKTVSDSGKNFFVVRGLTSADLIVKISDAIKINDIDNNFISKFFNQYKITESKDQQLIQSIIGAVIKPTAIRNDKEFENRKKQAGAEVEPEYHRIFVRKNQILIQKGEVIDKVHSLALLQLADIERGKATGAAWFFAMFIILSLLSLAAIIFIYLLAGHLLSLKNLFFITTVIVLTILAAKLVTLSFFSSYFIPVVSAAMLITVLLDPVAAFICAFFLSLTCGVIVIDKLAISIIMFVGCVAGIYFVRNITNRIQILRAGFFVGLSQLLVVLAFGLLNNLEFFVLIQEIFKGFLCGTLSGFIVLAVIPLFENFFGMTTNITLLELSNLNHPLLKQLMIKAPGSYHHSLMVGNLAEAACEKIGANSILAKIGAYYHDIGKIEKPEYFTENVASAKRMMQHEKLTPTMSSLIITNHVKDGVELAKTYKLPSVIIDFIKQHHGTSVTYYFYQKALEKSEEGSIVTKENFAYPGPKPQTKETAIVMLADAVEASSRSLSDPTPARIKTLVHKIINNKFIDGQLDECELTLKDLNKIGNAFTKVLAALFHTRIEYPSDEAESDEPNNGKNKVQS